MHYKIKPTNYELYKKEILDWIGHDSSIVNRIMECASQDGNLSEEEYLEMYRLAYSKE